MTFPLLLGLCWRGPLGSLRWAGGRGAVSPQDSRCGTAGCISPVSVIRVILMRMFCPVGERSPWVTFVLSVGWSPTPGISSPEWRQVPSEEGLMFGSPCCWSTSGFLRQAHSSQCKSAPSAFLSQSVHHRCYRSTYFNFCCHRWFKWFCL